MTMSEIQEKLKLAEKLTELSNALWNLGIEKLKAQDMLEKLTGYARAGVKSDITLIDLGIADLETKIADLRSKLITFKKK